MKAQTLCCIAAVASMACGSSPAAPSAFTELALGSGPVTDAYEYRYAPNDTVDVPWQEVYHRWAIEALDVAVSRRIRYNKYQSRAHMESIIGIGDTNGIANPDTFEIHTIWPRDNHEVVHLYSSGFGRPVALWNEGLAVAFQTDPAAGDLVPRWSRVALDDHARQFQSDGRLVPISDLLTTSGFRRFDPNITYPEAGSFMRFILETCGLAGVKRFFATGTPQDGAERVAAEFEAACGRSIGATEQAWLVKLESR